METKYPRKLNMNVCDNHSQLQRDFPLHDN
jgi:hypothetical protein